VFRTLPRAARSLSLSLAVPFPSRSSSSAPQSGGPIGRLVKGRCLASPFNKVWAGPGRFSRVEKRAETLRPVLGQRFQSPSLAQVADGVPGPFGTVALLPDTRIKRRRTRGGFVCGGGGGVSVCAREEKRERAQQLCAADKPKCHEPAAQPRLPTAPTTCRDG
jgi:hypothetical protein